GCDRPDALRSPVVRSRQGAQTALDGSRRRSWRPAGVRQLRRRVGLHPQASPGVLAPNQRPGALPAMRRGVRCLTAAGPTVGEAGEGAGRAVAPMRPAAPGPHPTLPHAGARARDATERGRGPMAERYGGAIKVVDYDPAWPARFAAARDAVARALGDLVV